jgi:nucleoid DNA-binding protein
MENKKPKTKRWNRWEKDKKKPKPRELTREEKEKLRQEQQGQIRHATEEPKKLNRESIANLITGNLREDPKLKKLAEEIAQKVIIRMLPEITELVISQMVKVIHNAVLKGARVEIRGLASWRTRNGKIKVKNHIKPKHPNQP